MMTTSMTKEEP